VAHVYHAFVITDALRGPGKRDPGTVGQNCQDHWGDNESNEVTHDTPDGCGLSEVAVNVTSTTMNSSGPRLYLRVWVKGRPVPRKPRLHLCEVLAHLGTPIDRRRG
jgi:hypothetical protein